jgi:hypothetical protein
MKMASMKLGNTPRLAAWSPPLASFSPPALILVTSSSNSLPHLAAAVFLVNGVGRMICSMWRPTAVEAINRQTPRAKGVTNRAKRPLGRSDWADRPRPFLGRFWPVFLPGCFLHDSLFVHTRMWAFDVVSFTVKA